MLFKFTKLIYSFIIIILFLGIKFSETYPTDRKFIQLCLDMSWKLMKIKAPATTDQNYHGYQQKVPSKEDFNRYILKKIELLAKIFGKIQEKINNEEKSLFDIAINKFETSMMNAEKDGEKYARILKNSLDGNKRPFFDYILKEYPASFSLLDELLWKIDDANLKEFKQENGKILIKYTGTTGANHFAENVEVVFVKEYIELRKNINEFINELKIEIVCGQAIGILNEIGKNSHRFKKQFKNEFEKMDKNKIEMLKTILVENSTEKFEKKSMKIIETKEIPREYRALFFYNLLNNVAKKVSKELMKLVDKVVNGNNDQDGKEVRREMPMTIWALIELVLKPMLQKAFDETIEIMSIKDISFSIEIGKIMKALKIGKKVDNSIKIIDYDEGKSNRNRNNKNEDTILEEYPLVRLIETKLELPSNFLILEGVFLREKITMANFKDFEKNELQIKVIEATANRESDIRYAAAKLLLAYERLKHKYYLHSEDAKFIPIFNEITDKLKFKQIHRMPVNQVYSDKSPLVTDQKLFANYIVNKMKYLADNLTKFNELSKLLKVQNFEETINFDRALGQLDEITKKPNNILGILDQFLWKMDNLHEIEQLNGNLINENILPIANESDSNHSEGNVQQLPIIDGEYIKLREIINDFIKELKTEIVYGQGIKAISEIKDIHSKFKKIFNDEIEKMNKVAENFVNENIKIIKKKKELERKFRREIAKKENKDIPRKYNELYIYNLLNNAIIELQKNLERLVADAINGNKNGIQSGSIVLIELIVKPLLREAFDEAKTIPNTEEGWKFAKETFGIGSDKIIIENEQLNTNSNIKNSKKVKGKDKIPTALKFEYDLVKMIEDNLGLPQEFLHIERFFVNNKREDIMALHKSHIRIAAAKLLLVYERLKNIYYGEQKLGDDEKDVANYLKEVYMNPMKAKSFGELIEKYLMNSPKFKALNVK